MLYKYYLILILGIVLIDGCSKDIENHEVPILGHAGTGLFNPQQMVKENTAEAVAYALSFEDLAGIEVDVQLSKEGTFWLYHDEDLSSQTNGEGQICERSDEYLETLHHKTLNQERLTTLSSLSFEDLNTPKVVFLDLKFISFCALDSNEIDQIAKKMKNLLEHKADLVSFYPIVLGNENKQIFKSNGFEKIYADASSFEDGVKKLDSGFDGVFVRNVNLDKQKVNELKQKGEVVLFDLRAPSTIKKALRKKPDFLMVEEFRTALAI